VHKVGMVRMPSQRRLRVATRRYEATAAAAAVEGLAGWKVKKPPSIRPALPKKTCVSIAPTLGGLRVLAKVYVALEQHTNEYCVHCGLCTCQWHLGNYAMTPYSRQPPHARAHLPQTVPTWYPRLIWPCVCHHSASPATQCLSRFAALVSRNFCTSVHA